MDMPAVSMSEATIERERRLPYTPDEREYMNKVRQLERHEMNEPADSRI